MECFPPIDLHRTPLFNIAQSKYYEQVTKVAACVFPSSLPSVPTYLQDANQDSVFIISRENEWMKTSFQMTKASHQVSHKIKKMCYEDCEVPSGLISVS